MFNDLAKTFSQGQMGGSNFDSVQSYVYDNFNIEYFMYFLVVTIFIGIAVYVYYEYVEKKMFSGNNEFHQPNDMKTGNPVIHYFHATWCPHCCKIKENPSLCNYIKSLDNKQIDDNFTLELKIHEHKNDPDHDADTKTEMDKYKVTSFPTLILDNNSDIYEFEAKIDEKNIEEFLETVLNS